MVDISMSIVKLLDGGDRDSKSTHPLRYYNRKKEGKADFTLKSWL